MEIVTLLVSRPLHGKPPYQEAKAMKLDYAGWSRKSCNALDGADIPLLR
jgi:hypothetical protein